MGAISSNGKVKISGGKVIAKCATANDYLYSAIYAKKGISNKTSCLKDVKGSLSKGAKIKSAGSVYKVSSTGDVTLKSYGASSKKPKINKVSIGGVDYDVTGIGAKAFKTKKGKAITAITLGSNVRTIGSKAFYGTSKLKKMNVKDLYYWSVKLKKTAFAKCGKTNGAKLKVVCPSYTQTTVKKLFTKHGMSKKANFK